MDLTIIVPTHMNRTVYLERMLDFYSSQKFDGQILIGDSSEEPVLTKNIDLIDSYKKDLNIKHAYYPKDKYTNAGKVATDIMENAKTNYVCFSGDDDFQIPETLEVCVAFLKHNTRYIGAHGCKIKYSLFEEEETNRVKIGNIAYVRGQQLDVQDPLFRFRGYMRSETSPQYHVVKKSVWKKMYKYSFLLPDTYFLVSEVLPCSIYYISGPVKRFDNIIQYMMEQTNVSYQSMNFDYMIQGVNSQGWGECVTKIREIVVSLLIKKGINKQEAIHVFDTELNFRILKHFHNQFLKKYQESFEEFSEIYQQHVSKYDQGPSLTDSTVKESINLISPSLTSFLNRKTS